MANTTWKMPLSFVDCHSHCEEKIWKYTQWVKIQPARHGRLPHRQLCVVCVLTSPAARPVRGLRCVRLETRGTVSWHRGVSAAHTSCTTAFAGLWGAVGWLDWKVTHILSRLFLSDLFFVFSGNGGGALFTVSLMLLLSYSFKTQICVGSLLLFSTKKV